MVRAAGASPDPNGDRRSSADDGDRSELARRWFEQGLAEADAHRWTQAVDRFDRARAARSSPEIIYNLSTALSHTGQLVRASALLQEIVADPSASPAVKGAAHARLTELRPRLAHLTVARAKTDSSSAVIIDGNAATDATAGVEVPLDPAEHSVQLREGSTIVSKRDVVLHEGERKVVTLAVRQPERKVVTLAVRQPEPEAVRLPVAGDQLTTHGFAQDNAAVSSRASDHRWVWALVGAAAVGAAAGLFVASRSAGGASAPMGNVDTWHVGGSP